MKPDYSRIAASLFDRGLAHWGNLLKQPYSDWDIRKEIQTALEAAYAQGYRDCAETPELQPEEIGVIARMRMQKHVAELDDLSRKIGELTRDIKESARSGHTCRCGHDPDYHELDGAGQCEAEGCLCDKFKHIKEGKP